MTEGDLAAGGLMMPIQRGGLLFNQNLYRLLYDSLYLRHYNPYSVRLYRFFRRYDLLFAQNHRHDSRHRKARIVIG